MRARQTRQLALVQVALLFLPMSLSLEACFIMNKFHVASSLSYSTNKNPLYIQIMLYALRVASRQKKYLSQCHTVNFRLLHFAKCLAFKQQMNHKDSLTRLLLDVSLTVFFNSQFQLYTTIVHSTDSS